MTGAQVAQKGQTFPTFFLFKDGGKFYYRDAQGRTHGPYGGRFEAQANMPCAIRWAQHKRARIEDLDKLLDAPDYHTPELGRLEDYALCFDYVPPHTFSDQNKGYWRYQISWGGPSEELRFSPATAIRPDYVADGRTDFEGRIKFAFLDWGDGEVRSLVGKAERIALELWDWHLERGMVKKAYLEAMAQA